MTQTTIGQAAANIQGAVALVTGANRGIGAALVDALVARGVKRVYAASRMPVAGRERVVPVQLDVTSMSHVERLARAAPDVSLLFNNAGTLASFSLAANAGELQRDFDVNVFGTLAVTRALLPALEKSRGSIVNMLSVVALASMPAIGGYSASKAASLSMTQSLRAELRSRGVTVHSVFPGPVDTEMTRSFDMPKTSAAAVAAAILDGVVAGDEDIFPDAMAQQVAAAWAKGPKDVERQMASM